MRQVLVNPKNIEKKGRVFFKIPLLPVQSISLPKSVPKRAVFDLTLICVYSNNIKNRKTCTCICPISSNCIKAYPKRS